MNLKNNVYKGIAMCLMLVFSFCCFKVLRYTWQIQMNHKINANVKTVIRENQLTDAAQPAEFTHQSWNELKLINEDFIGYMVFDDGYIEQAVVQGIDNEYYLQHDFYQMWNLFGSIYIDCECSADSQNITIYGHNVFFSEDEMFSPLVNLLDPGTFLKYRNFRIYFENEVVSYRIRAVYYYDINEDRDFDYRQHDFNDQEFTDYIEYVKNHSIICEGLESIAGPNRIVTLQTCRDLNSSVRILFLCTEESLAEYE